MAKITEGDVLLVAGAGEKEGVKAYVKSWEPEGKPKAILAFVHGFSDHCNAYYDFFPSLASVYNIAVHGFDQRGWGRTVRNPKQRGLTGPTTLVLADIRTFLLSIKTEYDGESVPLFLMGHSMGGGEALHYMLSASPRAKLDGPPLPKIRGMLLEAPFVALDPASQPNGFTLWVGKLASKFLPHHQMLQKLDSKWLSRSAEVRKDWETDPLCHDTATLEGLADLLRRAAELKELGDGKTVFGLKLDPGCPVWLGHGTEDHVVSYDAAKRLFDRLKAEDKTFKPYQGAYHKLHIEPEGVKEEFLKNVGEWILARAAGSGDFKAKL